MSATQDAMVAAVNNVEAAAQQLAQALVSYTGAFSSAAQTAYSATSAARAPTAVSELDAMVGPERVAQAACGRLRTLGAERVVVQPPGLQSGAAWTTALIAKITSLVP